MRTRINITGKKFGRLVVIKSLPKTKNKSAVWLCICDCGNEKEVSYGHLITKHTQSCGCLQVESRKKTDSIVGLNYVIRGYKKNAKKRNLEFNLSDCEIENIIKSPCFYCGQLPQNKAKIKTRFGYWEYNYNGIDRVDNTKGYFVSNCVACCSNCNHNKKDYSIENMIKCLKFLGYEVSKI